MNAKKKQAIAKVIIKILKSRFDTFPEYASTTRNAPFHKAFLEAFSEKIDSAGTDLDTLISMSSWMHGLNTTLGQSFFESTAHILCEGDKRGFDGNEFKIYSSQEQVISEIMADLKNGDRRPNVAEEDRLMADAAGGELVRGTNFTADCCFEDSDNIVAIELKSVRPNSGETRGEKQKILKAKAALRIKYPDKNIKYYFGFPFDPTADTETGYCKTSFMDNMIEFTKFCDADEILLSDELWSFLSGEAGTMGELLCLIRSIATVDFAEKLTFISDPENLMTRAEEYKEIVKAWALEDEVHIAANICRLEVSPEKSVQKALHLHTFDDFGHYNERRAEILLDK